MKKKTHTQRLLIGLLPLALLTLCGGCSPITLLNAASPSSHYIRTVDIPYGDGPRQRLDLYQPRKPSTNAPLVVFFYGGGWKSGSKENYEFVASSLTEAGFVVAMPDYQLYPQVQFPTFVEDGAAALVFAMRQADRYGADRSKVYVMGHSAGAHIAALLALDRRYLEKAGGDASQLAGLVGLSGPYDFLPIDSGYLLEVFPEATRADSQPVAFASPAAPPALLIHGGDDKIVEASNSESLAAALSQHGAAVTLKVYPDLDHTDTAVELSPPLDFFGTVLEDCIGFISRDPHQGRVSAEPTPAE